MKDNSKRLGRFAQPDTERESRSLAIAMSSMMLVKSWVAVALYALAIDATPSVTFPINSQVPPVARVDVPFTYSFSDTTFSSTSSITYVLSSGPTWLSLDSGTRTLSGTPQASDANTAPVIEITATDATGSVSANSTLVVVSGSSSPVVNIPIASQLSTIGTFSYPSTISYYPSTPFNFSFAADTFTVAAESSSTLNYYAVTTDDTPLPSWMTFEGSTLTFSGTTPDYSSLIQPPQTFGFQLIASSVIGFSETALQFHIAVGIHQLAFSNASLAVGATAGVALNFTGLSGTLQLSGAAVSSADLVSVTAQTPSWLSFDNSTFALSGTPLTTDASYNVTITAVDVYGDTANATVHVNLSTSLFTTTTDVLNATLGTPFSHNFTDSFVDASMVDVKGQISPTTSWLSFDAETLILSGNVPSSLKDTSKRADSSIQFTLDASSKTSDLQDSRAWTINVVSAALASSSRTSSSTPTSSEAAASSTAAALVGGVGKSKHKRLSGRIIAAIVVPILAVAIVAILCLLCCCLRRRKHKGGKRSGSPAKSDISGPVIGAYYLPEEKSLVEKLPEKPATARGAKRTTYGTMRRSQTLSAISSTLASQLRDSQASAGMIVRSYSEGVLYSSTDPEWRSTQESSFPTMKSLSTYSLKGPRNSNSTGRITRNFSRKANPNITQLKRDSTMLFSESGYGYLPSEFEALSTKSSNFEVLGNSSIQRTPEANYSMAMAQKRRSAHNYLDGPDLARRESGIGHGIRKSLSRISGFSAARSSMAFGHGQPQDRHSSSLNFGPPGQGINRESSSWVTVNPGEYQKQNRQSKQSRHSVMTESTDILGYGDDNRKSVKLVPKSPVPPLAAHMSMSSNFIRPVSRRTGGGSPWFAGASRANSRRSPASRYEGSYTSSSPMPNQEATHDNLEKSIMYHLGDVQPAILHKETRSPVIEEPRRDGLGISWYGVVRNTERLQSLYSRVSQRVSWKTNSPHLSDNDSRYRSAEDSPHSLFNAGAMAGEQDDDDYYDDEMVIDRSVLGQATPNSYQSSPRFAGSRAPTSHSYRDSNGHIEYNEEYSPELESAAVIVHPSLRPSLAEYPKSRSPNPIVIGPRLVEGAGRRPVSTEQVYTLKTKASFAASHIDEEGEADGGKAFV